jgi:hypothetical protein
MFERGQQNVTNRDQKIGGGIQNRVFVTNRGKRVEAGLQNLIFNNTSFVDNS